MPSCLEIVEWAIIRTSLRGPQGVGFCSGLGRGGEWLLDRGCYAVFYALAFRRPWGHCSKKASSASGSGPSQGIVWTVKLLVGWFFFYHFFHHSGFFSRHKLSQGVGCLSRAKVLPSLGWAGLAGVNQSHSPAGIRFPASKGERSPFSSKHLCRNTESINFTQ